MKTELNALGTFPNWHDKSHNGKNTLRNLSADR